MKYPVPLKADILIHAGDFTMYGDDKEVKEFNDYLGTLTDIKYKVVIAGNHEPSLDKKFATDEEILKTRSLLKNCIYLQDSSVMLFGLKIYGSPWQPRHAGNGFQAKHSQMKDIWKNIPDDTDILVTHGPPHGFGDKCGIDRHVGCVSLYRDVSLRVKPKYHIFGHIHEGYGMWSNGETTFINAAICNRGYKPDRPPIIFDIDPVKDN
jgi:Icc-related predicted phosphoesterase